MFLLKVFAVSFACMPLWHTHSSFLLVGHVGDRGEEGVHLLSDQLHALLVELHLEERKRGRRLGSGREPITNPCSSFIYDHEMSYRFNVSIKTQNTCELSFSLIIYRHPVNK